MAIRENQPVQDVIAALAAIVALTVIAAAPVLAAPDRTICEDASEPTLDVASAEFSTKRAASEAEATDLLAPGFEVAVGERAADDDSDREAVESAVEKETDARDSDAAIPADASGPLVHKRQMYRRDI